MIGAGCRQFVLVSECYEDLVLLVVSTAVFFFNSFVFLFTALWVMLINTGKR